MEITTISLDTFLNDPTSQEAIAESRRAAESLILTGALIVRDSRISKESNDRFLDLFEDYFNQDQEVLKRDERPEVGFQVGVTLENTEKPKCASDENCQHIIASLDEAERPVDLGDHGADPKCRFFHRMSEKPPYQSKFPVLEAPNVIPPKFKDTWEDGVNEWGGSMKQAVEGVAQMVATGLGLERNAFADAGRYGSHLLAPTATDLKKYGKLNTIYAGFHTDLNFLTIHGQSRYPGLHIWARNSGKRIQVKIPPGCLLVQAGKQIEWLTGGLIKAGYHEVVCTQATLDTIEKRRAEYPSRPLIRISSTFFWHLTPDFMLSAIPSLKQEAERRFGQHEEYGEMVVGDQVRRELGLIALMTPS
ncbi:uncharacterized protein I303_108678 [Kwoniella dejecticola CBS 10117]|uniref:Isopenicillin N synthase-like Fe(2+) 2OG dioxygenase domain-containing protein n=1 Tax=Kwoniella dejecticola CBS 10117 TaxID=1296121 RepID=A0A1A5ZWQ3_9TREE|nr:uncharacterized protein I303_06997 [Kwoniella dejecticola CBS 10117]OBR82238.1 hypothetical protein I303_06997 [Kwoniella dejecticola CBS 10117]